MNKIAVFGKPGGGKSIFSRRLSECQGLPLYVLDLIECHQDGTKVDQHEFEQKHQAILRSDQWVIDGFGTMETFFKRLKLR